MSFSPANKEQITSKLDQIVRDLKLANPGIELTTPRAKAMLIASYLRTNNLTGIEPTQEYHSLKHNYLGFALSDPNHNSLPLISAVIYCFIARRLGLSAHPCGFPFHVHVIILPPLGTDMDGNVLGDGVRGEPMYMDPFRSEGETTISDLRSQLNFLGVTNTEQASFLGESSTEDIVLRCGKNILHSIQRMSWFPNMQLEPVDMSSARYAALWSSMLLTRFHLAMDTWRHLELLVDVIANEFPSDFHFIEKYISIFPNYRIVIQQSNIRDKLQGMQAADETPRRERRRIPGREDVLYRVGQVFQHRRYGYTAVIFGWDAKCGANKQWMRTMGVDRLRGGSHQGFYHAL